MAYVFLVLFGLLISFLSLGPLSHSTITGSLSPNIVAITIWGFVWLTNTQLAYRWAIIIGLIFDFVSFLPFGFWTLTAVFLTYIASQLRDKFFELSSPFQALVVLGIILVVWEVIMTIVSGQMRLLQSLYTISYSLIVGSVVYYVFAVRFKLLQRWLGRRI